MNKKAFSLAEMMVVMLVLTIVLAASTPIITKRATQQVKTSGGGTASSAKGPFYGTCGYDTTVNSTDIVKTVDLIDGDDLDVDNLKAGTTLSVRFKTANSAVSPKLGIKGKSYDIYDESGYKVDSNCNPAYFPADAIIEFTYNGTYWYYNKKVVINYSNNSIWYRIYSDGWIEQGNFNLTTQGLPVTITYPKAFRSVPYVSTTNNVTWQVAASTSYAGGCAFSIAPTTFKIRVDPNGVPWSWYACGY